MSVSGSRKDQESNKQDLEGGSGQTAEIRSANQPLEQADSARAGDEERFHRAFDQTNAITFLLDQEFHIQQVNRAFADFTGYLNNEAAGKLMTGLLQIPPIELSTFWQINPFKEGQQWRRNLFIWTKSGREVEITLSISGLFDRQGRLVEYIATMRDITLRQQLEKAQQQFMSSISHEVRTPLTNLILYMRLLRQHPDRTAYLDILDQQIERLQTLMTGVIEISDLTLSKGTASWQMVPLTMVLRSATEGNRERAHSRHISFELGPLPADLPVVNGDPIRLSQALGELIKNAVEFTPEGGQVNIETRVIEVKKLPWVTIAVRDTGPGISLEEQEYIFGNFFRGEEAERNNIPGAGLGLPMAQAIVKAHGGQIVVNSEPGQGSTFTLWLPTPQALLASISR